MRRPDASLTGDFVFRAAAVQLPHVTTKTCRRASGCGVLARSNDRDQNN